MSESDFEHSAIVDAHDLEHRHSEPKPYTRLGQLLRPERRDLTAILVFAIAVAILSLATPIAVETLINTVAFGILMWPVLVIAIVLFVCLALAAAIRAMQVYVIEMLQRRLFVRVVADYAHRLPRLQLISFDTRYGPELVNRFFDVLNVQKSIAILLLDGVALIVTAVVGMVVLAFYHPFLLGFDVVLLLMIAFILLVLGRRGVRTALHESHAKYDVAAWLEELLRALRPLKFASGTRLALQKADELATEYINARRSHFRIVWRQTLFAFGLQVVASTVLLGLGGYLVINRQLTLGQLVAAEMIVTLVVASVSKLGKYAETYYDLLAGAEKLGLLTDLPLEPEGGEVLKHRAVGMAVSIRSVDQISHRPLPIHDDWHIAPNERVAIVGPPGSGKTTLFEVLCGLRVPAKGVVELDGIDLRGLSLNELREQVALVEGSDLFIGTVLENVRVGRMELTNTDVRKALSVVGLLGVLRELPQGLETQVIPDGSPLSGSQAIRLAIARAIVGRPRLLILDGVLDSLNLRECPDLLPTLFDRSAPWTLLVASTNPTIVGMCDRIISLAGGELPQEVQLTE
jgi:ABC-type bacteriocin/lantibiotic exporter with double-glycine peptidase domain